MIDLNKISDITIAKKLTILFLVVAMGFVAIAATYWFVLKNERESIERSNLFIKYGQLVSEAQKNYFKVRRFEKDFLLSISASTGQTYNDAPLDEHAKHILLLEKNMGQLSALSSTIDSMASDVIIINGIDLPEDYISQLVTQASTVVEDYKTSFADIVKFNQVVGFTDSQGLRQKANALLSDVEDGLSEANNAQLFTSLAKIRSYEKHILQSIDLTESFEDLKNEHQKFTSLLNASELDPKNKIVMKNSINEYVNFINEIVSNKRNANEYTELYDFMLGPMFDEMGQSSQLSILQNQAAQEKATDTITAVVAVALIAIAILISFYLYFFGYTLTKPINKLLDTIHEVNQGNLESRVNFDRQDELGQLATAFDLLLDEKVTQLSSSQKKNEELNDSVISLIKAVSKLSRKDFTVKVPVFEDVTGAVGDSLNLLTKETAGALNDVKKISVRVAGVSSLVQKQSNLVMAVAEKERQQVHNTVRELNKSSDAMNKISVDAVDANKRADYALKNTQSALDTVNRSIEGINSIRDTIRETEKRIKRLGERSQEITGIVNLINSIAERTHILALNASMHAASAGEAGRGFGVVADEVQRLAESAREATTEIGALVTNIRAETTDTVTAMNRAITQVADGTHLAEQAGAAMKQTQESTENLVQAVGQITQSSKAQAQASLELVKRSNEIVESTHTTDKHLHQQTINTNNLVQYSNQLLSTVGIFKLPELRIDNRQKNVKNAEVQALKKPLSNEKPVSSVTNKKIVNA